MWDTLLVLGQVPGTNIQLNLYDIILLPMLAVLVFLVFKRRQALRIQIKKLSARLAFKKQTAKTRKKVLRSKPFSHLKVHAKRAY